MLCNDFLGAVYYGYMLMTIFFFVSGLIIGSFLNVVICRLQGNETLLGRSFCRSCGHQIRWYDNIPALSFVLLRGKCRDCKKRISWQYPTVEILTAVLFALSGEYFFSYADWSTWTETAWLLGIIACFVVIAAYDLRHMEIPLLPLYISIGITLLFLFSEFRLGEPLLTSRLGLGMLGGMIVSAFFFVLVYVSKETWMGWGDVWLGLAAGTIVGLPAALFMLTVSFMLGAAVGIAAIILDGKTLKTQVPFAPFLVAGTFFTLFFPRFSPDIARLFIL